MLMGKHRYTVVLRYDPTDARIHQEVTARLARLAPNALGKIEEKSFTGRLILKRGADPATARNLKQLFDATGAVCDLHPVSEAPMDAMTGNGTAAGPPAAADRTAHPPSMQCPRCGCEQTANPECRACGVIIAKAVRSRPSTAAAKPAATVPPETHRFRMTARMRHWTGPVLALIRKIQHPVYVSRLTSWSKRVADRLISCGIVFVIALLLEIGLLTLGKMLWSLYTATSTGQYYIEHMPEQAQMFESIAGADPLTLGLDLTLVVFCVSLLVAGAAQFLHLIRYLYESQGIIGKLILWFIPCTGLSAWIVSLRHPYPELALAGSLAAVPTLCTLSSCLYLARILLPEGGDLRVIASIITNSKHAGWTLIFSKIRMWFDATKRMS